MAAVSTLAIVGLGVSAVGMVMQQNQSDKARQAQEQSAQEQRQGRAVSSAQQAQQAAQERRQQIREERVKRAQIMNNAELTGTSGSSSEIGAVGGMATQLGSNLGFNQAAVQAGQQITGFMQRAADFNQSANNAMAKGQMWGQVAGMGGSLFSSVGGWNALFGNQPKKS